MEDIFRKISYSFDSNPFNNNKWATVVIVYVSGKIVKKPYIENPWGYIQALRKNTSVKAAYIERDSSNDSDPFKK